MRQRISGEARRARIRGAVAVLVAVLGLAVGGCIGQVTSLFDPEFLTALGLRTQVASLPGDAPALVVGVENRTERIIEAVITYRGAEDDVEQFTAVVEPQERTAQALVCPVTEITLGDLADPSAVGAIVRLGQGNETDPFIEVEPFGAILQDGLNYDCGDGITFYVQPSADTRSGFRIFAEVRRAGS